MPDDPTSTAREAWPAFSFDDAFAAFVRARGWPSTPLALSDLALAWACLTSQRGALEAFTAYVQPTVDAALARVAGPERDDLRQALWLKLFTGAEPGLHQYSGVGSLKGWLRVAATRLVINLATRAPKVDESEEALLEQLAPRADPELEVLKRTLAADFEKALAAAFLTLTSRERQLLRQVIGKGATVDQVAVALGVPRSTAGRHVKEARERFAVALRRQVSDQFGSASVSARRMLDLLESQLDQRWLEVTRFDE